MDIGARLKVMRKERGLSQRELAKRAGVTNSTISLIEQNRVSPSVASLRKVLEGLPMTLSEFFTQDVEADNTQIFFSADQMPDLGSKGIQYLLVGSSYPNRKMSVMREVYPLGSDTGDEMISHDGEEAGVVVSGELEISIGEQTRVLTEGEGYYFDCRQRHRFRNLSDEDCVMITACTPPAF